MIAHYVRNFGASRSFVEDKEALASVCHVTGLCFIFFIERDDRQVSSFGQVSEFIETGSKNMNLAPSGYWHPHQKLR